MRFVSVVLLSLGLVIGLSAQVPQWTQMATDGPNDYLAADSTFNQFTRDLLVGSDLDHDGRPEIIVTDYKDGGRVHVFEVVGPDSIQEVWTYIGPGYPTYQPARSVAVGDLDGDSLPEIILHPRSDLFFELIINRKLLDPLKERGEFDHPAYDGL